MSAVCFSVLHLAFGNSRPIVVKTFLVKAVDGAPFTMTGNLVAPILAHQTNNVCYHILFGHMGGPV